MDQVVDRRETDACAKWTLGSIARTGALLAAAVLASILMVDPPIPHGQGPAQPYVPASDTWIDLGAPQRPESSRRSDLPPSNLVPDLLHRAAAVEPAAVPEHSEAQRELRRTPS